MRRFRTPGRRAGRRAFGSRHPASVRPPRTMRDDGVQLRARERDRLRRAAPDLRARVRPVGRRARPPRTRVARGRPRGRDRTALAAISPRSACGWSPSNPPTTCARSSRRTCPRCTPSPGPRRPSRSATARPTPSSSATRSTTSTPRPRSPRSGACSVPGRARAVLGPDGPRTPTTLRLGIREIDEVVERERSVLTDRRGVPLVVRAARARRGVHDARTAFVPDHADDGTRRGSRTCSRRRATSRSLPEPRRSRLLAPDRRARGRAPRDARARGAERRAPVVPGRFGG